MTKFEVGDTVQLKENLRYRAGNVHPCPTAEPVTVQEVITNDRRFGHNHPAVISVVNRYCWADDFEHTGGPW